MIVRSQDVKRVWKDTCANYGTTTVNLRSRIHRLYYRAVINFTKSMLLRAGIDFIDKFLSERYIAVRFGSKTFILIPEDIGSGGPEECLRQAAICAHEHEHVLQLGNGGIGNFMREYFLNPASRAIMEGNACAAEADVMLAARGYIDKPAALFDKDWKRFYLLRDVHAMDATAAYAARTRRLTDATREEPDTARKPWVDGFSRVYATEPGSFVVSVLRRNAVGTFYSKMNKIEEEVNAS